MQILKVAPSSNGIATPSKICRMAEDGAQLGPSAKHSRPSQYTRMVCAYLGLNAAMASSRRDT